MIPLIAKITSLEAAMMGRRTGDQASLFYEFRLDDRIPKDHLLRRIDVAVGPILDGVRDQLKPYYSEIGRPSVQPPSQSDAITDKNGDFFDSIDPSATLAARLRCKAAWGAVRAR